MIFDGVIDEVSCHYSKYVLAFLLGIVYYIGGTPNYYKRKVITYETLC